MRQRYLRQGENYMWHYNNERPSIVLRGIMPNRKLHNCSAFELSYEWEDYTPAEFHKYLHLFLSLLIEENLNRFTFVASVEFG